MACVLLPWLLVYLGLHVVQRGIIFIDIAMAQMASLGICIAVLLQFEPESLTAYLLGVAATLVGAVPGALPPLIGWAAASGTASTGGWAWQAWAGGDPSKPLVTDAAKQCFECHHDYVYSTYIP